MGADVDGLARVGEGHGLHETHGAGKRTTRARGGISPQLPAIVVSVPAKADHLARVEESAGVRETCGDEHDVEIRVGELHGVHVADQPARTRHPAPGSRAWKSRRLTQHPIVEQCVVEPRPPPTKQLGRHRRKRRASVYMDKKNNSYLLLEYIRNYLKSTSVTACHMDSGVRNFEIREQKNRIG